MNPRLEELLNTLKKDGFSQEEIDSVIQGITNTASARLYGEMTMNFTEADWGQLDACADQEEADAKVRLLFAKHSEKSPEAILDEMFTNFADGFLVRYQEDRGAAVATPVEPSPANTPV
jgi:hypothetical protein